MNWLNNLFAGGKEKATKETIVGLWKDGSRDIFYYYLIQLIDGKISIRGCGVDEGKPRGSFAFSDIGWNGRRLRATQKFLETGFIRHLNLRLTDENTLEGKAKEKYFSYELVWKREENADKVLTDLKKTIKRTLYDKDPSVRMKAATALDMLYSPEEKLALQANEQGVSLLKNGSFEQALESFDRALVVFPDDSTLYSNKGVALNELKRYTEAIACIDRAIALHPDQPGAPEDWNNKGNALLALTRYAEALGCFEKAVQIRGLGHGALSSLGGKAEALAGLQRYTEAVQVLDLILLINPNSQYAIKKKAVYIEHLSADQRVAILSATQERQQLGLPNLRPLSPDTVSQLRAQGAWVVDMRDRQAYKDAHLPVALTIPLDSPQFSMLMKMTVAVDRLIILVIDETDIAQAVHRINEVGKYTLAGYLEGGVQAWRAFGQPTETEEW